CSPAAASLLVRLHFLCHVTPPTGIYSLSLHDALPISVAPGLQIVHDQLVVLKTDDAPAARVPRRRVERAAEDGRTHQDLAERQRSEEHTSELQSLTNIVCRLLLEKKKNHNPLHPHRAH